MSFLKSKAPVLVSICIPVHNTEKLLPRCLESVAEQKFDGLELVLINDQSTGKDELGRNCKKIVRSFYKKSKIPVAYLVHNQYVPLLETRRQLVEQAHGEYILMVDSDDLLAPGAVQTLYNAAKLKGADITCGQERVYKFNNDQIEITEHSYAYFKEGEMFDRDIFDSWLLRGENSAFLWAKLIKRELYLNAFNAIPYMDCSIAVDTPIYFFLAYYAKSYYGINDVVYYYLTNEGITNNKPISDLKAWRRHCTVASIYALLLTFDGNLTEEEKEGIRKFSRRFMKNAIVRLREQVIPELRSQSREMLCDFWGEGYVKTVEKLIDEASK